MANKRNRNAQGTGTIRQRPDGRWEARYTVGRDPGTGKQVQKSIYGKTQAEVRKKLQAVSVDIDNGVYTEPSNMTVGQWLDIWLQEYTSNLKPYTIELYRGQCKNQIKPQIGAVKLTTLKAPVVQRMYNTLYKGTNTTNGLSEKTIKNIHGVLHKALGQAVKLGYIRNNPSEDCTLPRVVKKEVHPLDDAGIKAFLSACNKEKYKMLYIITLFTGMRQGEVLGLTWDNVDFETGLITVDKQLQRKRNPDKEERGKGIYYFSTLKNNQPRKVAPAPFVMQMLKLHKKSQAILRLKTGSTWGNSDPLNDNLVFTDEIGQHLKHKTVYKHYKAIVKEIGLENSRFHDLRHPYITLKLKNLFSLFVAISVQKSLIFHTTSILFCAVCIWRFFINFFFTKCTIIMFPTITVSLIVINYFLPLMAHMRWLYPHHRTIRLFLILFR